MTKLIKKISAPLISLIFLLNMSSAGMADTTVSAEVGFIFNTLLFIKKCIRYLCKKYRVILNCRYNVLARRL